MELADLAPRPAEVREQAAGLLHQGFDHPAGWPSLAAARGRPDIYMSKPVHG
jgi:hypothetical protein